MHASGLNSLALVLNYSSDPSRANAPYSGAVTVQPDGTLAEPHRARLIRYLEDARAAGFTDMTIRFVPQDPNSPQPWSSGGYRDEWDASLYAVDWRFIQDVRA